jgi:O-antigen/teichoic acid export membrane protein
MAAGQHGDAVSFLRRLGTNSAIYLFANFAQKGAAFLLIPLYTVYLVPEAYGILTVVSAINGFLTIAFTLALTGAITRFYFEYQDDPETLAEFWGTIICAVLLLSIFVGALMLLVGSWLLKPFIGSVPFWPFVALGIIATFFQPFFFTYLAVLQTRNQAWRYAVMSIGNFLVTTLLTLWLVVFDGRGVTGALAATLISSVLFFIIALWSLRHDFKFCLKWRHLRAALGYSLPQVPHALASQTTAITDRLILNSSMGTATTGIYAVGAMVAMVVEIAAQSINRSYVPLSMEALRDESAVKLDQLRQIGSLVTGSLCLLASVIAVFATELIQLLTPSAFAAAASVIPLLAFAGVASAIYYLFVNILFYDRTATRFIPVGTLVAAGLNVALALTLVPYFGLMGAASATLVAQTLVTILIAFIGKRFDPVSWAYGRYFLAFITAFACSYLLSRIELDSQFKTLFVKATGLLALTLPLGAILWSRLFILPHAALKLLQRTPRDAAHLFMNAR